MIGVSTGQVMHMGDQSVLSVLTEAKRFRWWLAPQEAEAAWPNRGNGPAAATLRAGAVVPPVAGPLSVPRFRPINTTAGNSHIELGEQPFDFSGTGLASFAVAFRYDGQGSSLVDPRLLQAGTAVGARVLISTANMVLVRFRGAQSITLALGPITIGEDYVFVLTFNGGDTITAGIHDMSGEALYLKERSASALGDATPNRNTTVFGFSTNRFVSGELGDVIIDNQSAWSVEKRRAIAAGLNIRASDTSSLRGIWEAGEKNAIHYSYITPEMFRSSSIESDDALMFRAALEFADGEVPLIAAGKYRFESAVNNIPDKQFIDISNAIITLPDGHTHNGFLVSGADDVEMKLGTFNTGPGSRNYPIRVSSCHRFKSTGGRFNYTLGSVAYYNSSHCVSQDLFSYQTKWGGNIQSGCLNTGFVNCVAIESEEHGFYMAGSASLVISNCYFQICRSFNAGVNGVKIASHCVASSVSDCVVNNSSGDGIYLWQNVADTHVKGNEVFNAGGHGISLWRGNQGGSITASMVHDNVITECVGSGIRSDCADSQNEFWHNRSRDNGAQDSFLDTDFSNVPISSTS